MKIARFGQAALGALAVLLISGAGIAFAGNGAATPAAAVSVPALATPVAAPEVAVPAAEPVEAAGVDTDTLQGGDQTTLDAAGDQTAPDAAAGVATEKAGVEEPGDANLPGGGHADDPNDASADYQFEGVE